MNHRQDSGTTEVAYLNVLCLFESSMAHPQVLVSIGLCRWLGKMVLIVRPPNRMIQLHMRADLVV